MKGLKLVVLLAASIALAAASEQQFSSALFGLIARDHAAENVILSPLSIEMCLGLVYLGAEGSTAAELVNGLRLESANKTEVAENFGNLFGNVNKAESPLVKLSIANRVYIGQNFEVAPKFNQLAETHFGATVQNVDFSQAQAAAGEINAWVEEKTKHKIKHFVEPSSLQPSTASVLVNAIYFYATWQKEFEAHHTMKIDFMLSATRKTRVEMMYQEGKFLYGEFRDLKAKVIELPYSGAGISMMVILPNELDGLAALEDKLQSVNLLEIPSKLSEMKVRVSLPKFKVEFEVSLKPTLQELGIREIFTDAADFSSLLTSKQPLSVSEVKHKAFIEVNERGTEAAGATGGIVPGILPQLIIVPSFKADHPFVLAIKDNEHVYFVGHITNPSK